MASNPRTAAAAVPADPYSAPLSSSSQAALELTQSPSFIMKASRPTEGEINPYYFDYKPYYRWVMLVVYTVLCILAGPFFFNWPPLERIFNDANAYSHLCDQSLNSTVITPEGVINCEAKKLAIASLLPAAVCSMFSFDIVAGLLLDLLGGKICSVAGLVLQAVGWFILIFSSRFNSGYLVGLVFTALGADPGFFGLLSIPNLFPGWESTVVAVLGAARSLSYANSLIMEAFINSTGISFHWVAVFFCVLTIACLVATAFVVPFQSFPRIPAGQPLLSEEQGTKVSYSKYLHERPKIDTSQFKTEVVKQTKVTMSFVLTVAYGVFCLIPILALTRNSYYSTSYAHHLPNTTTLYTILNPLSFIPCPLVGIFADRVSTALTMMLLAFCGALSMFVLVFKVVAFEYISLFINFIFSSFLISQFYCYIAAVYPQREMGKLIGISLLIGGVVSLIADPINAYAVRQGQYLAMDLVVTGMQVLALAIALFLYFTKEKPLIDKNKKKMEDNKSDALQNQLADESVDSHVGADKP